MLKSETTKTTHDANNLQRRPTRLITEPFEFDSHIFSGRAALLFNRKPPPNQMSGTSSPMRRFELQIQGTFTERIDTSRVFFGCECLGPVDVHWSTALLYRAVFRLAAFAHDGDMVTSLGARDEDGELVENPSIVFGWECLDTVRVTPPGEPPCELGTWIAPAVPPPNDVRNAVENGHVITVSYHNSQVDLIRWLIPNLRGIGMIRLSDCWGGSPIRICAYTLGPHTSTAARGHSGGGGHRNCDKRYLFAIDLKNNTDEAAAPHMGRRALQARTAGG